MNEYKGTRSCVPSLVHFSPNAVHFVHSRANGWLSSSLPLLSELFQCLEMKQIDFIGHTLPHDVGGVALFE